MAVTIARIERDGTALWCLRDAGRLVPLDVAARTTAEILALGAVALREAATGEPVTDSDVRILSPVTRPDTIICQGLNYADHSSESGHAARKDNLLFGKASSSVSGPFDDVIRPAGCRMLDYEVELGLVLAKPLRFDTVVAEADVPDFVGGFVICNDISARDVMFGAGFLQWFRGKSARTFSPCGPWLLVPERDEFTDLLNGFELKLWLNGELRQHAFTADMIFKPHDCLTDIATFMELEAGDLLMTGTPGGVIAQGNPAIARALAGNLFDDAARLEAFVTEGLAQARYMQPGDVVRTEIVSANGPDLGIQEFKVADARSA